MSTATQQPRIDQDHLMQENVFTYRDKSDIVRQEEHRLRMAAQEEQRQRARGRYAPSKELQKRVEQLQKAEGPVVEKLRKKLEAAELALHESEYLRLKRAALAAKEEYRVALQSFEHRVSRLKAYRDESKREEERKSHPVKKAIAGVARDAMGFFRHVDESGNRVD